MGLFEKILIAEALTCGNSTVGSCVALAGYGAEILLEHGSEQQKKTWIPKIAEAEILSSCAFTEEGMGNDLKGCRTTAVKDGNFWLINGSKTFAINGGALAGFYIVLCKTNPEAEPPEQGMSTILVDADCQGVSTVDVGNRLGNRLLSLSHVDFNNVHVPLENLIGEKNKGYSQVRGFFQSEPFTCGISGSGDRPGGF